MSSHDKGPRRKASQEEWVASSGVLMPTVAVPMTREFPRRKEEERRG